MYLTRNDQISDQQFVNHTFLFPGHSCFPLSEDIKENDKREKIEREENEKVGPYDQTKLIVQ